MKKFITALLLTLAVTFAFADDWYVCMGSFTKAENAETYVNALSKSKIKTFQQDYTDAKGTHYIRVFYDEGFEKAETARMVRDSLAEQKVVKDFKMTGLWICQTTKPAPKVVEIPKPAAEPKKEPAKAETKKAEPAKTETKKAWSYDLFDQLPYISGYELKSFKAYGIQNILNYEMDADYSDSLLFNDFDALADMSATAVYQKGDSTITVNALYNLDVYPDYSGEEIFGKDYSYSESTQTFACGSVNGLICLDYGNYYFAGFSEDRTLLLTVYADEVSEKDFVSFSNLFAPEQTVFNYACMTNVQDSLAVLDLDNAICVEAAVDLDDSFVDESTDWGILMRDCWKVRMDLVYDDEFYFVSLYDLNAEKHAQSVSDLYMTDKFLEGETINSHKMDIGYESGWYEDNDGDKSVTFTKGRLFINVSSYADQVEVIEMAEAL